MRVNLRDVAAVGAHAPPLAEGSRIKMVPSLEREKGIIARWAETRGLLRLPVRAKRSRDVFNSSVLSVRLVPGRRILSNAIPANGLFAPTSDRAEEGGMQRPSVPGSACAPTAATSLKLTPMGRRRTNFFSVLRTTNRRLHHVITPLFTFHISLLLPSSGPNAGTRATGSW
jgi:hypothetical protein